MVSTPSRQNIENIFDGVCVRVCIDQPAYNFKSFSFKLQFQVIRFSTPRFDWSGGPTKANSSIRKSTRQTMNKRKRSEEERRSDSQMVEFLDETAAQLHEDALCIIIEYLDAPALLRISLTKHTGWSAPVEATLPRVFPNHFPFTRVDILAILHAHGTRPPRKGEQNPLFTFTKHFQGLMRLSAKHGVSRERVTEK